MQFIPILYFAQTLTVTLSRMRMALEHAHMSAAHVHIVALRRYDRFRNFNNRQL